MTDAIECLIALLSLVPEVKTLACRWLGDREGSEVRASARDLMA